MFWTYPNKILCFYAGMLKPVVLFFFQKKLPKYFMSVCWNLSSQFFRICLQFFIICLQFFMIFYSFFMIRLQFFMICLHFFMICLQSFMICLQFLVALPLPSGATYLVTMASVCMSVCMYGCSLVKIFFTKGFFFDTWFGLIHVQTGKKISTGDPPPPPQ